MTERVQGTQSAWKNHVPGGNGALCCPPRELSQQMFEAFAFIYTTGGTPTLDLDASTCGQDEPLSGEIRPSIFNPPGPFVPPVVSLITVGPNLVRVLIDATGATDGDYVLELTNACGCCALLPLRGISL